MGPPIPVDLINREALFTNGLFHLIGIHPLLMTDICPRGGRSGPRLSKGVEMLAVPGGLASFLACPRRFKSLFMVVQGGLGSSPACPRGVKMPCPRVLVADGKIVPWGSKLSQDVPRGLTLFLRVVLGVSQIYVISRGCMPIKWKSPM